MPGPVKKLAHAYGRHLGTWYVALATVFVLAVAVLLPGLGTPGLWEPSERVLADRAAPPLDIEKSAQKPPPTVPTDEDACTRTAPEDAKARTLSTRAVVWGRDISDSDAGRRLPFAIMGLLTVLGAAGIAMRFAGPRAGVLTSIVLLSMALCVLQSRMLTNEIGTACGATLLVYGLVALSRLGAGYGTVLAAVDAAIGIGALVVGYYVGFGGGGMLLGLVVPIASFAAAGICAPVRRQGPNGSSVVGIALPFVAAGVAACLLGVLAYQLYDLKEPTPGMLPAPRTLFGNAIVADGCWSTALGGLWRPDDDLRMIFDSTFEEIAYGTFPWGILAPIAMGMLLVGSDRDRRGAGAIALAWTVTAWIATEAFQRKVGFAIFAAFPALAIAVGVWLDDLLTRRALAKKSGATSETPAGYMLLGLLFLIAVVNFGKDMYSFPDRPTSLLIGGESLAHPKASKLLFVPTRLWILLVGAFTGLGVGISLMVWRDGDSPLRKLLQKIANVALIVAIAGSVAMAAFWSFAWQPVLAHHLSSKTMFETFEELRKPNEKLVIMGDLGHAPASYTDQKPTMVGSRAEVVKALADATLANSRVFAIAPQGELCTLHREMGGNRYYVVEDRNVRNLLISNKVDGTTDKNPLATAILHEMPTKMKSKPKAPVVWDKRLELIGWDMPERVERGKKFSVTMYYKVTQAVGGKWKSLMHFDGPLRFNGDHWPIDDRCPTGTWQPGDYIVDTFTVSAGGKTFPAGRYELWMGFFTGSAPNWKNMTVSQAPSDMRDTADRVKIASIILE
ncbi:MAG: ArnT family glycosyltransferase [Kofleriaceae bacterium]